MEETSDDERVARALAEENTGMPHNRIRAISLRVLDADIEWATTETPHCSTNILCRLLKGHSGVCKMVGPFTE